MTNSSLGEAQAPYSSCTMEQGTKVYEACASPKELLVIPGASHAEAYYKEADRYEHAIEELIARFFGKEENKV